MFQEMLAMSSGGGGDSGIKEVVWIAPSGQFYSWNITNPNDTARTGYINEGDYFVIENSQTLKAKVEGDYICQTNGSGYATTVNHYSAGDVIYSNFRTSSAYCVCAI